MFSLPKISTQNTRPIFIKRYFPRTFLQKVFCSTTDLKREKINLSKRNTLIRPYLNKKARIRIYSKKPLSKMPLKEAISYVKRNAPKRFLESIELTINLNIDVRKNDQIIRSFCNLPNGHGKKRRVFVFSEKKKVKEALEYGATKAGNNDLAKFIKENKKSFDIILSSPQTMKYIGPIAKILGQRGKMPNVKQNTVIRGDLKKAINDALYNMVLYRTKRSAGIRCPVGMINFTDEQLLENIVTVIDKILVNKPKVVKRNKTYIINSFLKSTQGRSVPLMIGQPPFIEQGPNRKIVRGWGVLSPRMEERLKKQEESEN